MMKGIKITLKEIIKKILFKYTKLGAPNYSYNLEPLQLAEIINSLEQLKKTKGNICEIGVARGMTTRFIAEYLQELEEAPYFYCIDTFSSFNKDDIDYEIKYRKKTRSELIGFSYNDFESWKRNFKKFEFIKAIKIDVKDFDFTKIKPIKFALLDVDLYLPTLSALKKLKNTMITGGIIIVDDVSENNKWDGAGQAFNEFVKENSLKFKIVGRKCGVIEL